MPSNCSINNNGDAHRRHQPWSTRAGSRSIRPSRSSPTPSGPALSRTNVRVGNFSFSQTPGRPGLERNPRRARRHRHVSRKLAGWAGVVFGSDFLPGSVAAPGAGGRPRSELLREAYGDDNTIGQPFYEDGGFVKGRLRELSWALAPEPVGRTRTLGIEALGLAPGGPEPRRGPITPASNRNQPRRRGTRGRRLLRQSADRTLRAHRCPRPGDAAADTATGIRTCHAADSLFPSLVLRARARRESVGDTTSPDRGRPEQPDHGLELGGLRSPRR